LLKSNSKQQTAPIVDPLQQLKLAKARQQMASTAAAAATARRSKGQSPSVTPCRETAAISASSALIVSWRRCWHLLYLGGGAKASPGIIVGRF